MMTPLRQRMIDDMRLRNFAYGTQRSSHGLVHRTVYSLSRRSKFLSSPAFLRRETEQTFFIPSFSQKSSPT
jgi:hypothetical protein